MKSERLTGPIEDQTWATHLQSHVVTPDSPPRIHGYDVERDLARNYSFVDTAILSVLGDLPSDSRRRAIDIALQFLAPMSVAHAPTHAGMLTRLCGATRAAAFAAGTLTLAEDARWTVESHADFLAWLNEPVGLPPATFASKSPDDRASVASLRRAIARTGLKVHALDLDVAHVSRMAAILSVLWTCGVRESAQLELLLVIARLPCVGAEILATNPAKFRTYPINLPPFQFEAPQ